MTPDDIIAAASECMETPFRHQGRVPGVGLDCAGLLVHCFKRLGLPHQDERGYPRTPFDGQLERILDSQPSLQRIALADAGPGDWLIMRMSRDPQHIALHAGFERPRAVIYSVAVASATPFGAIAGYLFLRNIQADVLGALLGIAAGSFLYIAASDLLPETHRRASPYILPLVASGAAAMFLVGVALHH